MPDYALKLESIKDAFREHYYAFTQGRAQMARGTQRGAKKAMGMRPYVGRVIGCNHAGVPVKKEIKGYKSYDNVRSGVGNRGVFYHYNLPAGVYRIHKPVSQRNTRKFWAVITRGEMHEIGQKDAYFYAQGKYKIEDEII